MKRSATRRAKGFTLVELVTAAGLVSMMMIGVVEIFGVITETAAEAEGISFSHQQLRGLFDALQRDLQGMTREGYLRIDASYCNAQGAPGTPAGDTESLYAAHSLQFVTVGSFEGIFDTDRHATAAEVCYTSKVIYAPGITQYPNMYRRIPGRSSREDIRRGVIARAAWLLDGNAGAAADVDDASRARYLSELSAESQNPRPHEHVYVSPWREGGPVPNDAETLRRVMATCASEFYVEYWDEGAVNQNDNTQGGWRSETRQWDSDSDHWPKAIRVTAAIHHPQETAEEEAVYADTGQVSEEQRHRGYVLQQIFWIGDP